MWKVIDNNKCKELGLKVTQEGLLAVSLAYVPKEISVDEFIRYLQEEHIVVYDNANTNEVKPVRRDNFDNLNAEIFNLHYEQE